MVDGRKGRLPGFVSMMGVDESKVYRGVGVRYICDRAYGVLCWRKKRP